MTPEEFTSHPIHAAISLMNTLPATNVLREALIELPDAKTYITQIFAMGRVIESHLSANPPELISLVGLNQIAHQLNEVLARFEAFTTTRQLDQLVSAVIVVSQNIQPLMWTFARPPEETAGAVYNQMLSEHRDLAKKSMEDLSRQHAKTKEMLEVQAESANHLLSKIKKMDEDAASLRSQASAQVAELQSQYHDAERDRKKEHDEAMQARLVDASKLQETAKDDAERFSEVLKEYETNAAKLYSSFGTKGVTGSYENAADKETTQANRFRIGAIVFFSLGVTMALGLLEKWIGHAPSAETMITVLFRIGATITITLPGWYLARESARHRTTADRARQTQIELAALGPFIELMEKDKKDTIREELIKKYFGNGVQEHTVSAPFNMTEVSALVEALSKFREAK